MSHMSQLGVCACVLRTCALMVLLQVFITICSCLFLDSDVFDCKCMGPQPQALICFKEVPNLCLAGLLDE